MSYILRNSLVEKQLKIVCSQYFKINPYGRKSINLRCNVCGDTPVNKSKKSAYLLLRHNPKYGHDTWQYYCHRGSCGASMLAETWLERYFPIHFRYLQKDLFSNNKDEDEIKELEDKWKKDEEKEKEYKKKKELEYVKHFVGIEEDYEMCSIAQKYCQTRLIDYNIWSKWYVAVDGIFKNRLIIPFYNKSDEIYFWQGRALDNNTAPKYLNRFDNRDLAIYNLYNVDEKKPVIVLEGIIDSLFVENGIAVIGTNVSEETHNNMKHLNKYYLFDNDVPGFKKSLEYLSEGDNVFLWKKFLRDNNYNGVKDINDLVIKYNIKQLTYENLQKYFTNNIFDKFYLI